MFSSFQFHSPTDIRFGAGVLAQVCGLEAVAGRRCLLLTFPGFSRSAFRETLAAACGRLAVPNVFEENPTERSARGLAERVVAEGVETVIAVGGGSSIDMAKAAVWFADNPNWELDGQNGPPVPNTRRIVAVPTTAGTGSEVTPYAILTDVGKRKRILNHPSLIPGIAICDPGLTVTMPPHVTAHTGIDALSHAIEAYLSTLCAGVLEDLALATMDRGVRALPAVLDAPGDLAARGAMMLAALEGGWVLAHCGTVMVHALGYCLTAAFGYPHGLSNALFLPAFVNVLADQGCARAQRVRAVFSGDPLTFVRRCGVTARIPRIDTAMLRQWAQTGYASYGRTRCVAELTLETIEHIINQSLEDFA